MTTHVARGGLPRVSRPPRDYTADMWEEAGGTDTVTLTIPPGSEAEQDRAAHREASAALREWVLDGEYGEAGARVRASYRLSDADSEWETVDLYVDVPPDQAALIRRAAGSRDVCGADPDDHEWTAEGEGGHAENPGVWSLGGTTILIRSHCARCDLRRVETRYGTQRGPGQSDEIGYEMPGDGE